MPTKALPIWTVNPLKLKEVNEALDWALALDEPSVIRPCVLKKQSEADKTEFGDYKSTCEVGEGKCIDCKACIRTGCPALRFNKAVPKATIDKVQCIGCEVFLQVCPGQGN